MLSDINLVAFDILYFFFFLIYQGVLIHLFFSNLISVVRPWYTWIGTFPLAVWGQVVSLPTAHAAQVMSLECFFFSLEYISGWAQQNQCKVLLRDFVLKAEKPDMLTKEMKRLANFDPFSVRIVGKKCTSSARLFLIHVLAIWNFLLKYHPLPPSPLSLFIRVHGLFLSHTINVNTKIMLSWGNNQS